MNSVLSRTSNLFQLAAATKGIAKMSTNTFKVLSVSVPKEYVYHVKLNRPEKRNAFNNDMILEMKQCFDKLSEDEDCRAVVISGEGQIFSAGIDLQDFMKIGQDIAEKDDIARKAKVVRKSIETFQASISSLELCNKPVLAAIHSACIGAGVDLITASDIRYCTKDAYFCIKEVDVGLAADVGTLARLPKVIGSASLIRELCYTARKLDAAEALSCGLVSKVFESHSELIEGALNVAENIAKKSPVAVQTTKSNLVYSQDHTVQEALEHIKYWNQLNLQSEDLVKAATSIITKDNTIKFSKL